LIQLTSDCELDLRIALSVAMEALSVACEELESLQNTRYPMPDWIVKTLDQHAALSETMQLVQRQTKSDVKAIYREAAKTNKWAGKQHLGYVPVNSDVSRCLEEANELLRRAQLNCPVVREVAEGIAAV
jgi:bacterioferritin-associated ferredoxin